MFVHNLVALRIGSVADRKRSLMALVPETDRLFVRPAQISGPGCRYGAGQIIVPPVHADPQIIPGEAGVDARGPTLKRSEEHTSELQSLMRISYAVFCLKKKK